jgi:plastocyanin
MLLRRTFLALLSLGLPGLASGAARLATPQPSAKAEPAPQKPKAKAGVTVQITISGIAFADVKQPLAVGDTVEWINKDVVAHTATATNKNWRVVIPENGKAPLVLKKAGTVDYYCEYHPNMTGRLVVRDKK